MATGDNVLQQVATYQNSMLAYLQNLNCFVATANTKFKNFQNLTANLGATVDFSLPPRMNATTGTLVANFAGVTQRSDSLTVDSSANTAYSFSNLQDVMNLSDQEWMRQFGKAATEELSAEIEADVATAALNTYRCYGDGTSAAIDSYTEIAQAVSLFRNYGSAKGRLKFYLPDTIVPTIIGNGLGQFVPNRNNEIAQSWELGDFNGVDYYMSNLLPIHTAGYAGQNNTTLTFASINSAGDEITFTVADNETDYVVENDILTFQTDVRFLTFTGHKPSANSVQVRVTEDATSAAGSITVKVTPALVSTSTDPTRNLSRALTTSDTAKVKNSHRVGLIVGGDALYLAMPRLPEEIPFPTVNEIDPDTAVSIRMYYGSKFGMDERGFVHDAIWGKKLVPEYAMRVAFPI